MNTTEIFASDISKLDEEIEKLKQVKRQFFYGKIDEEDLEVELDQIYDNLDEISYSMNKGVY